MKPVKTLLCTAMLCMVAGAVSLHAQQFRLNASPNYPYFLDNIYDLRNSVATVAAANPVGLVQFIPAQAAGTMGTSIERYNPVTGAVLTPDFNYIPTPGTPFRHLRGTKFTEGFGSYFVSGTVSNNNVDRIFLLKVATGTGVIAASRYLTLPANVSRPVVSNIMLVGDDALYVSGTVLYNNNQLCVFAFRTNLSFTPIAWFRIYPLNNRNFVTFAQCLVNDGNNGLVIAGVDNTNNRAVVLRVNPANGAIGGGVRAFSLCTGASCAKINRVSLGLSGAVRNMVVQTIAANLLFNVSQMNGNWTAHSAGTTYKSPGWDLKSVRFESAGVLLSHLEASVGAAPRYNRSRYNAATGTLLVGTASRYQPPTLDLTGIASAARQIETISLTSFNNRVFSVGKYRHNILPTPNINTLAELQPAQPGCQAAFDLVISPEKLSPSSDTVAPVPILPGNLTLPTTKFYMVVSPVQVCAAAATSPGERSSSLEEMPEATREDLLTAFPSPFTESLTVTLAEGGIAEIMLFDLTGKMIRHWQFDGTEPTGILSVPGLTSGIYLLRVRDDSNQWHYRKILKE